MIFFDWEQAFYSSQPMAREAGIIEIFHGRTDEDPQVYMVLTQISSKEAMEHLF
jgi:heme-degrading monooxygenase HmoA